MHSRMPSGYSRCITLLYAAGTEHVRPLVSLPIPRDVAFGPTRMQPHAARHVAAFNATDRVDHQRAECESATHRSRASRCLAARP
jgi:hypothetical protein